MSGIEDARNRMNASEELLKKMDYAGAIREGGACIELSVKALLDTLSIEYIPKQGRIPHDVSDKVPEAFEKLKPFLEDWQVEDARKKLARAMVLLKMLASVRSYVEYPIKQLGVEAKDVFDYYFSRELGKSLVDSVVGLHISIRDLIAQVKRKKKSVSLLSPYLKEKS